MYFIVLLLYREDMLDDFLSIFVEAGINDAIVVNGTSFARSLVYEVPIFAGLRKAMEKNRSYSYVIFGYAKDEYSIREVVEIAKEEGMDLDRPGVGMLLAINIAMKFGQKQELA
ncbi:MAG: hypothetical protein JW994_06340 [Candidatus Omnitrophica bacterium]|nr:hypothetical protein [Candidatus Omnitrophota bacterium]